MGKKRRSDRMKRISARTITQSLTTDMRSEHWACGLVIITYNTEGYSTNHYRALTYGERCRSCASARRLSHPYDSRPVIPHIEWYVAAWKPRRL